MKARVFRGAVSLIMSICLFCSLLVCLIAVPATADSARMLVWDNVGYYSRLHYRPDTGDFVAGKKYVYSFDFDNLTKTDESRFFGVFYRTKADENSFERIPHSELGIVKTEVANGFHYEVTFTVPENCYSKENILFKYGDITSNGYIQNMRIGNLDLWELDDENQKVKQIQLSLPDSIDSISIVKTDNVVKNYGPYGKWMGIYAYMTGISLAEQNGYFEPEIVNPFEQPKNTLRLYKGAKKVYAEYVDNNISLTSGEYVFGCKYKTFGTTPDFDIFTSTNNGATYTKVDSKINDSKKNNRSVKFTLKKSANALKIVFGNTGEGTDVSLAVAGVFLTRSDNEKQLISGIDTSTLNIIGLSEDNADKKWNIHTDTDNAAAIDLLTYDFEYFATPPTAKTYQNVAGKQFSYVIYQNNSFVAEAKKEYILTADYKVLSGTFDNDDVSSTAVLDPAFRVKLGNYVLENSKANYFNVLNSHFDDLTGKLYIRFSSKTKRTKLEIIAGNYSTSSFVGSCAVGNVSVCECFDKADGVTVYKDNIIDNINVDTLNYVKNGTAETEDRKWNAVYTTSKKEYKITDYSSDYFKASPASIEIKEGAKGALVSYNDSSLNLSAGKKYAFTVNLKTIAGNPDFSLGFKNIGTTNGKSYSEISEDASFLSFFNDEFDRNTYLRTITFKPKVNISDIRILFGNIDKNDDCGLIVANAQLYCLDSKDIPQGENLIADMIKPNIKRDNAQKVWYLNANEDSIEVNAPIKDGIFLQEKMIKFEPNSMYNRVEYYDQDFEISPSTTYRFTADFIVYGGNPTFSIAYYDKETKSYKSFQNISVDGKYSSYLDKESNVRGIEFKIKSLSNEQLSNIGDFRIMVGNSGEAKDISCVFANPQMHIIENGNPVGDNLVKPITDETVLYMTSERNYEGFWDLRYQGSKGVAVKLLEIPDNYFRAPVLAVSGGSGIFSQTVTVKPNTNYKFTYYVKTTSGEIKPYIKSVSKDNKFTDIKISNVLVDKDGYYSYSCEFKTPSSLQAKSNLRVGITFNDTASGVAGNFRLFELNSGFEPTGGNIITNGNFTDTKSIPEYAGGGQVGWTFEGTLGDTGVADRAIGYFVVPTSKMFIFVGGYTGNYIGRTETIEKGKSYNLSFNLKYANPGYEGDSGVDLQYLTTSDTWKDLPYTDKSPKKEFKKSFDIKLPDDAADANNLKLTVRVGSSFVSGYIANAKLVDITDTATNLLTNGNFSDGLIGWNTDGSFKSTYFTDIPNGYFNNPQTNKPGMIVYRNSGTWENFCQTYLNLKPNSYYLFKAKDVHPWEGKSEDNANSVFSIQLFANDASPFIGYQSIAKCTNKSSKHTASEFVTFTKSDVKNKDGEVTGTQYTCDLCGKVYSQKAFDKLTQKVLKSNNNHYRIYKIRDDLKTDGNAYFRLVMQGAGNAGYWGDIELYECDEKGNILSNNVLINGDFSLGEVGWSISPSDTFNYRIVEQPDKFFETYKKNSGKMITSKGTAKNATLGQSIEVERGKTYYFSGFYVNMNAAGVTPKVTYKTVDGKTATASAELFYDPDRFFFEIAFTLPDDAFSNRGKTTVNFLIDNANKGKGYISDLAVYEEGKYENLLKNADFKNGFNSWKTNSNYKLSAYNSSVFVFYYDDKKFDDGDWSGTATAEQLPGEITGRVLNSDGDAFKNIKVTIIPTNRTVKTGSEGNYRFSKLKPGEYSLYVTTPYGQRVFIAKVTVSSGMITNLSDITISLNEETQEIDFVDYPEEEITYGVVCGYLLDYEGKPIKGQTLYLGDVGKVITEKKGAFQFDVVPAGEYDIYTKLDNGQIHIFRRVKVVAGKGSIYKLRMPAAEDNALIWIIIAAAGGVLILGGGAVLTVVLIKKKKKSRS